MALVWAVAAHHCGESANMSARVARATSFSQAQKAQTVELVAVGDVMLGRYVGKRADRDGADVLFKGVRSQLLHSDITFGNLECVLSDKPFSSNKRNQLRANPACADTLKRAGFDILSLANNHALDCGKLGLKDTIAAIEGKKMMTLGWEWPPKVVYVNGMKLGFLAYCDFPNDSGGKGIRYTSEETLAMDIGEAQGQGAEVIIVSWHWGSEGSVAPTDRQRHLATLAAKCGADVILGHHPLVLQPVEWIKGAGGKRCLVAYSLGNFVFDATKESERKTAILKVKLGHRGCLGYSLLPCLIQNGAPIPLKGAGASSKIGPTLR